MKLNIDFGQAVRIQLAERRELESALAQNINHGAAATGIRFSSPSDLTLMPATLREEYKTESGDYYFPLTQTAVKDLLRYMPSAHYRDRIYKDYMTLGTSLGPPQFDNQALAQKISVWRQDFAQRLGGKNYAEIVFQERAFKTPENILSLIKAQSAVTGAKAKKNYSALQYFVPEYAGRRQPADLEYLLHRQDARWLASGPSSKKGLARPDELLDNFLQRLGKDFDINWVKQRESNQKIIKYHVYDQRLYLGAVIYDLFNLRQSVPRSYTYTKNTSPPEIVVRANLSLHPETGAISTFANLIKLAHETGHVLDYLFDKTAWKNLESDLVELTSSIVERYAQQPEIIKSWIAPQKISSATIGLIMTAVQRQRIFKEMRGLYTALADLKMTCGQNPAEALQQAGELTNYKHCAYWAAQGYNNLDLFDESPPGYGTYYYCYFLGAALAQQLELKTRRAAINYKQLILKRSSNVDFQGEWKKLCQENLKTSILRPVA